MKLVKLSFILLALLSASILLGFYFTMSVSIMPGLDLAEPYAAIKANQTIGHATQQSVFFLALLGTPLALLVSALLHRRAATIRNWLIIALLGWVAMLVVTLTLNVPLNQMLDGLEIAQGQAGLGDLWAAYSVDWQVWNWLRVLASAVSVLALAMALYSDD